MRHFSVSQWSNEYRISLLRHSIRQFEHEPNLDPTRVAMVELRSVEKRYCIRKGASVPALVDFSLTLYQDQITTLIGPNGTWNRCTNGSVESGSNNFSLRWCNFLA